jgi:HEAT repeat protein
MTQIKTIHFLSGYFRVYPRLIFLCLLFAFAGTSLAQANLETLAQKIRSGKTEEKRDALLQIRNLESAEASRVAIPALRDTSEIVRATAAFSVIFLPKDEAVSVLLPLLDDKFELVRREAVYALGKVRNPLALSRLVEILQKDKIMEVRTAAAIALGDIGDAGAVDALTRTLQQKPLDKEEFLRRSAARSIGQIAQEIGISKDLSVFRSAVAALIQTLQNRDEFPDAKREAAFALGAIGDKSAIPVLEANINNKDYYLAEICKKALRQITDGKE